MSGTYPHYNKCPFVIMISRNSVKLHSSSLSFPDPEGNKAFWIGCKLSARLTDGRFAALLRPLLPPPFLPLLFIIATVIAERMDGC